MKYYCAEKKSCGEFVSAVRLFCCPSCGGKVRGPKPKMNRRQARRERKGARNG